MFHPKRFLLLVSISVVLLAGLMFTAHTRVSSTAFASGCNTVAEGNENNDYFNPTWSNNCLVTESDYNHSNFVVAIQVAMNDDIGATFQKG